MSNSPTMSLAQVPDHEQLEPDQHSDVVATRHLCAGVYLDRSFRDLVIRKVHNDSRRRVAPSYGFDLVPVVRHAWVALFLDVGLHLIVAGTITAGLLLGYVLVVVVVACLLGICVLLRIAARNLVEALRLRASSMAGRWSERGDSAQGSYTTREELRKRMRLVKATSIGCVALALTPLVVSRVLHRDISVSFPAVAVMLGVLVAFALAVGILRQLLLNANHRATSLRPATLTRREQVIDDQQSHPCVIYKRPEHRRDADPLDLLLAPSDAPSPFVGTGKLVNRWLPPMTVQLLRPDQGDKQDMAQREHVRPPFATHSLVDHLRDALDQLRTDSGAESLPGLRVADRVYATESDVSADRRLLRKELDGFTLRAIIDNHQSLAHHFLETSAPIAGGELVATTLIRVSLKGRCLSLDVATCALTRTPHEFQRTDAYAEHGVSAVIRAAVKAIFTLPRDAARVWRLVEFPIVLVRAAWATKDRTLTPRRGVHVGARVAVREAAADDWKNAQLDETTIYDHMKIIEQRIIKAAEDFLRAHNVDTSAFEKQATNIINSGVLNMGGTTNVSQAAIGASAQVFLGAASEMKAATAEATA